MIVSEWCQYHHHYHYVHLHFHFTSLLRFFFGGKIFVYVQWAAILFCFNCYGNLKWNLSYLIRNFKTLFTPLETSHENQDGVFNHLQKEKKEEEKDKKEKSRKNIIFFDFSIKMESSRFLEKVLECRHMSEGVIDCR